MSQLFARFIVPEDVDGDCDLKVVDGSGHVIHDLSPLEPNCATEVVERVLDGGGWQPSAGGSFAWSRIDTQDGSDEWRAPVAKWR
jgi:hypothetical protein